MKRLLFIVALICFCLSVSAQIVNGRDSSIPNYYEQTQKIIETKKTPKPAQHKANTTTKRDTSTTTHTIIQVGAGGLITSINFFKNGQEHTYYPAASCRLYYQPNNFIRFVLDYTKVQTATIGATWLNVKSTYLDLDAHILMHFTDGNKGLIYVILGASTQSWKGYYTGFDDYNSAADAKIKPKTNEKALYFGGSVGTGFEYRIIPRIDAYGEVRFRITNTDVGFGLSDVCYGIGIKYTLLKTHPKTHKNAGKHFKWFKGDFNKTVN